MKGERGLLMKLTRPIVGILLALVIMQFAVIAGLWIASFLPGDDPGNSVVDVVFFTQLALLVLCVFTFWWGDKMIDPERRKLLSQQYTGLRVFSGMFTTRYWNVYWSSKAPYAPRWLVLISTSLQVSILVFALVAIMLLFTDNNPMRAYGGGVRFMSLYPFLVSIQILPVVLSKWRELSQPAASPSPEVRPS
jgi:hypothetical protein